jgi:hypothetical protein
VGAASDGVLSFAVVSGDGCNACRSASFRVLNAPAFHALQDRRFEFRSRNRNCHRGALLHYVLTTCTKSGLRATG